MGDLGLLGDLEYGKPLDDKGLVSYFRECLARSKDFFNPIWKEADLLYKAYWGDTLRDADKEWLELTKRPPLAFNIARSTIDAVVGSDQADRKEVTWRGVGLESSDDSLRADLFTNLNRQFMNVSRGYVHEGRVLFDQAVSGYGFSETLININKRPMLVETVAVDPHEMYPDPDSVEDNFLDALFWIRHKRWTLEAVVAKWPDRKQDIEDSVASGRVLAATPRFIGVKSGMSARVPLTQVNERSHVSVYDFCYKRQIPSVVWIDPTTGEEKDGTQEEFVKAQAEAMAGYSAKKRAWDGMRDQVERDSLAGQMGQELPPEPVAPPPLTVVLRYAKDCWYRSFILGDENAPTVQGSSNVVLEKTKLAIHLPPYACATGYIYRMANGRVKRFGIMRGIYDPQLYINKTLMTILDLLGKQAKGGGLVGPGALLPGTNIADFVKNRSIPGNWTQVKDPTQIVPDSNSAFSENLARFVEFLRDWMTQISNVNDYLKGSATSERSNVLVSNMQASALNALNPFMEQFTSYRMEAGRQRLAMGLELPDNVIDKILDLRPEQLEGITYMTDPESGQQMPTGRSLADFMRDGDDALKYDVAVDIGQASPTSKQQVWAVLGQGVFKELAELLKEAGIDLTPIGKVLMKNLPLPGLQARELETEMNKSIAQAEKLKTTQGILETLSQMPPEEVQPVLQQAFQQMQQQQMTQQGQQAQLQAQGPPQ